MSRSNACVYTDIEKKKKKIAKTISTCSTVKSRPRNVNQRRVLCDKGRIFETNKAINFVINENTVCTIKFTCYRVNNRAVVFAVNVSGTTITPSHIIGQQLITGWSIQFTVPEGKCLLIQASSSATNLGRRGSGIQHVLATTFRPVRSIIARFPQPVCKRSGLACSNEFAGWEIIREE